MTDRLSPEEIIQGSLSLLDDVAGIEAQKRLDDFPAFDSAIEESLAPICFNDCGPPTPLAEEVSNAAATSALETSSQFAVATAVEIPTEAAREKLAPSNLVLTSSLGHRTSLHKAQNESLIKALQDLRAKMQESKLKSGKVLNNKT